MTLKRCLNYGLAFTIALSLAMANVKADDPEMDVYEYNAYYGHTAEELAFVAALNEYRATRGLHPVGINSELSNDCRRWSSQMRQRGQLTHDPRGGTEIIAQIAYESGARALYVWQRSPAHNAILLSSRIDTIGIGSDGIWWTMRGTQRGISRSVFYTAPANAETEEGEEEMIGRVPMGVLEYRSVGDVQRRASSLSPFRNRIR
ncbi:MAG: CAP domain-containing protein [Planctomycetaceae bacterium]|nr:CAP domain-containing protein [Planctomycetaceae bacterium]